MTEHTAACEAVRTAELPRRDSGSPDWPLLKDLPVDHQAIVLACPHPAHDTPRFFLGERRP